VCFGTVQIRFGIEDVGCNYRARIPRRAVRVLQSMKEAKMTSSIRLLSLVLHCIPITSSNAQWMKADGPAGGSVRSIVVCGTDLFAGTYGGGVFLSNDKGASGLP